MPRHFFWVQLVYLVVLAAIFVVYETTAPFRDALPTSLGTLPVEVPWFGAVGGALISLTGIFKHQRDWNPDYGYWHYSRPLIGAVIGSIGCLLFFVIVQAANSKDTATNPTVFDAVAFLVGYREETFRELIKRATDLLLSPGKSPAADSQVTPPEHRRPDVK